MLNTLHDRYFAGYAQTQANCNAIFAVCKGTITHKKRAKFQDGGTHLRT